jgi:HlyD family secretion protein
LVLAKDRLTKAKEDWERWENNSNEVLVANFKAKLAEAQLSKDNAESRLYALTGSPAAYTIANYEADLEVAKTNYANVQKDYDELLLGPGAVEIEAAEARIIAAQITLDSMYIKAPFSGTITDVDILVGDEVNMGAVAFRMDDFSQYVVDVNISEVDINKITEGQDVVITFDAIFAAEYQGSVSEVGQVGFNLQGVVYFEIAIVISNPDELVKPGMTSGVYITVEELNDVMVVPNRAVRIDDGDRIVYVLEDGEIVMKKIILGASADAYSEVVSGELVVGDLVILNPPTNSLFGLGGGGGFRGMGG